MNPIKEFEQEVVKYTGTEYAIAVSSGTSALVTALSYFADTHEVGSYVITTPFTFPATANAIIKAGFKPLFVDIERNGFNIDPLEIKKAMVTENNIVGILPVHLFGKPCDMTEIMNIAKFNNLFVVEDCSQAFGSRIDGKHVGTFGNAGTFSFYASKNLHTFEGGMVITNDGYINYKSRMFINHGFNEKGEMIMFGDNYKMSWLSAFIGQQELFLHKKAIEAELGVYGLKDGYYKKLVYEHSWYNNTRFLRWDKKDCSRAEELARFVEGRC